MEFDVVEPTDPRGDLLVALGWGNGPSHRPVEWLLDQLTSAGWRVHAATLPVHVTDVEREWVEPLASYAADLDDYALLAHSAGGLAAAHADLGGASTRTYLSPWWGEPPARRTAVAALAAKLPGDLKILPSGLGSTDLLGEHATRRQLAESPDRVSPAFLRAVRAAHQTLPSIPDDAVAFCSLTDRVISTRAIGERVPAERLVLYDGGHELFSSRSREDSIETVLAALDEGPAALE